MYDYPLHNINITDYFGDNPTEEEFEFYEIHKDLLEIELYQGLKKRPKKPDVFNNVSINTPYYINIKAKLAQFAAYEEKHKEALKSFDIDPTKFGWGKIAQQQFDRYGWFKPCMYLYDDRFFDSAYELELYIFAVDHDIELIRYPDYEGDSELNTDPDRKIYPDFKLGDKYICIAPFQFYKNYKGIKNDERVNPYDLSILYGCDMDEYNKQMNARIENLKARYPNIEFWDNFTFDSISKYIYDNYSDDYLPLFIIGTPFPWPNSDLRDTSPMGLVRHFHKSIFESRHGNEPTALEIWDNKDIFKKLALNRLLYVGECGLNRMRQGLNISKIATKVSVFKSSIAERLIKAYLWDAEKIFDPFSGFSGRMLGAMMCGKPYIGRDLNPTHIQESKEIVEWWKANKNPNVQVDLDVADVTKNFGVYDCLLTCSPYATIDRYGNRKNIETWNNPDQLALTCDEWIDICLQNYKCRKYVFVTDETIVKYRPYIVGTIGNMGHMGKNCEYIIYLDFTNYSLNIPVPGKGFTPYDLKEGDEYTPIVGKGITPFDIPQLSNFMKKYRI